MAKIKLYTDGAARGNPGKAGAGIAVFDSEENCLAKEAHFLGNSLTNNSAEYQALLLGLELASSHGDELDVFMDSELIVKQMRGEYKIKHPQLKVLNAEAQSRLKPFKSVHFHHVPREKNRVADQLANEAIDTYEG